MRGFCAIQKPPGGHILKVFKLLLDEVPLAVVAVEVPLCE